MSSFFHFIVVMHCIIFKFAPIRVLINNTHFRSILTHHILLLAFLVPLSEQVNAYSILVYNFHGVDD